MRHHLLITALIAVLFVTSLAKGQTTHTWTADVEEATTATATNWDTNTAITGDIGGDFLKFLNGLNVVLDQSITNVGGIELGADNFVNFATTNGATITFAPNGIIDITSTSENGNFFRPDIIATDGLTFQGDGTLFGFISPITGAGDFIKNGAFTFSFDDNINMDGNIILNAGTLQTFGDGTVSFGGSKLIANGGTLDLQDLGEYAFDIEVNNDFHINGRYSNRPFSGDVTLNNTPDLNITGFGINLTGNLIGTTGFTKSGIGQLLINLAQDTQLTGDITVNEGQLSIGSNSGGINQIADSTLITLNNSSSLRAQSTDEVIGGIAGGPDTNINLRRPLILGGTGDGVGVGSGRIYEYQGIIRRQGPGSQGGPLTIDIGSDTQILSGNNAYTRDTILNSGTLLAGHDNALGSANLVVNGGFFGAANGMRTITNNVVLNADLNIVGDDDLTLDGVISGDFGITQNGGGTLTLGGANTFTGDVNVNQGIFHLNGSILGNVNLGSGAQFTGDGDIGGSLGTQAGATFNFEINKNGDDEVNEIDVNGALTLAANTIFNVTSVGDDLQTGDTFTVITTMDGVTDEGIIIDAPGLPGLIGQINGDDYELLVATFTQLTRRSRNPRIGAAIDRFVNDNPGNALATILQNLNNNDLHTFIDQVDRGVRTPNVMMRVSTESTQAFNNLLSQYLASARSGNRQLMMASQTGNYLSSPNGNTMLASLDPNPMLLSQVLDSQETSEDGSQKTSTAKQAYSSLLPERTHDWSFYLKTYGVFSDQDSDTNRTGYNASAYGFQMGLDRQFGDQWIAGLAFGYTNTDADIDADLGDLDVDTFRIGPYATYEGDGGRWYLDMAATYGYHRSDSHRSGVGTSADADYNSYDLTMYLGTGYNFSPSANLRITPTASLQYQYFNRDDYTETGAGAVTVDSDESNTLYGRVGLQLAYRFDVGSVILVPEFSVGWEHEFLNEDGSTDASFVGGGSFTVQTAAPRSDSVYFGAGLTAQLNEKTSLFARYEGTTNSSGNIHGITAGLRLWF